MLKFYVSVSNLNRQCCYHFLSVKRAVISFNSSFSGLGKPI